MRLVRLVRQEGGQRSAMQLARSTSAGTVPREDASPAPPRASPARAGRPRPKSSPSLGTPRRAAGLRTISSSVMNAGASPRSSADTAGESGAKPAALSFAETETDDS